VIVKGARARRARAVWIRVSHVQRIAKPKGSVKYFVL
jgi:hypothetical protein